MQEELQMKKLIYMALVMIMISACSDQTQTNVDDTLPTYDVAPYCQEIAGYFKHHDTDENHSYSDNIFNSCLKEEKVDYEWLKVHWNLLSSKSKIYCKQAIGNPNKNYNSLKMCTLAGTCLDDHKNLKICAERERQE